MAKSSFDTSFNFGANVKPKKAPSTGTKGHRGKRRLSEAQRATAMFYMKPRRR
jgi:hypothetical protein